VKTNGRLVGLKLPRCGVVTCSGRCARVSSWHHRTRQYEGFSFPHDHATGTKSDESWGLHVHRQTELRGRCPYPTRRASPHQPPHASIPGNDPCGNSDVPRRGKVELSRRIKLPRRRGLQMEWLAGKARCLSEAPSQLGRSESRAGSPRGVGEGRSSG
jgi:hypothetical protein